MADLTPQEEQTKQAYDKLTAAWTGTHENDFYAPERQRFHELLPAGSVLEIGSGGGRDAKGLIALGYSYVGTDISAGLLAQARANVPGANFYEQSVYNLDFPGHEFDGFWSAATLLHVPKERIGEALNRIASVIKPGGIGFISLKDGDGERMKPVDFDDAKLARLFVFWHKDEFTKVLGAHSFEVVDYQERADGRPGRADQPWHCFFVKRT